MKKLTALIVCVMMLVSLMLPALAETPQLSEDELNELNELLAVDEDDYVPDYRIAFNEDDLSVTEGLDETWMNILLMGVDNAGADRINGRTDAMMILSVNTVTGESKLASIVRDLYVELPETTPVRKNRINTAYVFGGPKYAMKTVNATLGLNITRYCTVNFRGFEKIVDKLGGVDIEITAGEANQITKTSKQFVRGDQVAHLNGKQALAYARIRKLDNNFGRNERQRKFLIAMLQKVLSENDVSQIFSLAEEVLKNMETNLSAADLINLIFDVLPNITDMDTYSCPRDGEYTYFTTESGAAVVLANDMNEVAASLKAFIYGE